MRPLKPKMPEVPRILVVRNTGLRRKVFERDQGFCCDCGRYSSKWQHDHVIPLSMGGADTLENSVTRCSACHRRKTNNEAGVRAKSDRIRARHELMKQRRSIPPATPAGAAPPASPSLPAERLAALQIEGRNRA